MERKEYNGWTNYETRSVNLWMDNDQNYWQDRADELMSEPHIPAFSSQTREDGATYALSEEMKDAHEEANPCADRADVFADLMSAALSEVNWYEIARHYIERCAAPSAESMEKAVRP